MGNPSSIAQMRVEDLIDTTAGRRVSPGAGAAGAVTLALAAACAAKAAAISLKHQPDNAGLRQSDAVLERIAHFALAGADRDAEAFTAFIKAHTADAIAQLVREGDKIAHLIDVLAGVLDKVAPQIEANMSGDIVAARALMEAARTIQLTNLAEVQGEVATAGLDG
jgi:formiminotetrahydrofolate cyclodeaminase